MTEDEMAGWHHRLNGHKSEYTPGIGDGQGGVAGCSPWGCKESETTERLTELMVPLPMEFSKQEYWSGLPFPSPGDVPDPGTKPRSPALQADALSSDLPGKPQSVRIV